MYCMTSNVSQSFSFAMDYPLDIAPKDSPLWHHQIPASAGSNHYRSEGDKQAGWWWLLPPSSLLPKDVVLESKNTTTALLRKCVGWLCPPGGGQKEAEPFCIRHDLMLVRLPVKVENRLFEPTGALAVSEHVANRDTRWYPRGTLLKHRTLGGTIQCYGSS